MKRFTLISLLAAACMLAGVFIADHFHSSTAPPPVPAEPDSLAQQSTMPTSPWRNAYFGELHLHTIYSLDANLFGTRIDPRQAYRFAMGEKVWLPESERYQQLKEPLDFAAVTDHAEGLGMHSQCHVPGSENYYSLACLGMRFKFKLMLKYLLGSAKQEGQHTGTYIPSVCGKDGSACRQAAGLVWQDIQDAANDYNRPGRFTTFIGYEYSPTLEQGGMGHRNVIFRSATVPDNVFTAFDGFAEDLWRWLDATCAGNCAALAIPHNPNFSWGLMFGNSNSDATPLTRDNLALRARLEPLVEIFQVKGNSECSTAFASSDEECGFESIWPPCTPQQAVVDPATGQHAPRCIGPNDTVRGALKQGLLATTAAWGLNPFRLGFVGATDSHNGTPGDTEEDTWNGHGGEPDASPEYRLGIESNIVAKTLGFPLTALNPGGLTGVWAKKNTREALFDAMQRKETFATSGSRIRLRLFAGFTFPEQFQQEAEMLATAYATGVPMGGELAGTPDAVAPRLLVQAERDPNSAPLQKIQIVKGWVGDGETQERVYDVACSDGLQPDTATNRCPDNGASVNLATCEVGGNRGAASLATTWQDPDFDAGQAAFYYARVLENPSCRWSQYDANRLGVSHPEGFPASTRQRAWSSPIWYTPAG